MANDTDAKAEKVFARVAKGIVPSKKEVDAAFSAAGAIISKLERVAPPAVEIRLAGSLAKGTWLSGNDEFDIFLLFPRHYAHHEMTMLGLTYARRALSGMRLESRHAEHPYLTVHAGKYQADIVPGYRISDISERGSAVDRSPLHTEWVNARLDARAKRDVRLLKKFMKAFGIYGAELRVEGFSGYLCELLVAKYGSLHSLMKAASHWHETVISFEDGFGEKDSAEARKKFGSPLIVIDPTDRNRNVAAVVSSTSLSRFVFECRRFIEAPSEKFFKKEVRVKSKEEILRAMKRRETRCLLLAFKTKQAVPDILWPQLKKASRAIASRLEEMGFSVFGSCHWSDGEGCAMLFELSSWRLPDVVKVAGPNVRFASDVKAFAKKHKDALNLHIEHDRMVAVEGRHFTSAKKALMHICKKQEGSGIPEGIAPEMAKARLLEGQKIARKEYLEFLADYFFMKIA